MLGKISAAVIAAVTLCVTAVGVAGADDRPPPTVDYQAYVVEHFTNSVGDEVLYRRGWWYPETPGQGFGFDKVYWKHNIKDNQVVGAVVRNPGTVEDAGGGRWVHTGVWQWRQCDSSGNCQVKDQRTVRVVIDYAPWGLAPERGMLGVNTAYCEGDVQCPEWINELGAGRAGFDVRYVE